MHLAALLRLVAFVGDALRALRQLPALLFGEPCFAHVCSPFFLFGEMFPLVLLAELSPVDFCPALIERAVGLAVEVQLAAFGVSRRDLRVHVRMLLVAVDRGDDPRLRE